MSGEDQAVIYENRRRRTLTDEDLKVLADVLQCNQCSFNNEEADTLKSIAKNMNRASSLATKTIITGLVLGFLTMVGFALKHLLFEILKSGNIPVK